jgi:hypothetical protein
MTVKVIGMIIWLKVVGLINFRRRIRLMQSIRELRKIPISLIIREIQVRGHRQG